MDWIQILKNDFLLRQIYQYFKNDLKLNLQSFKTFEKNLRSDKPLKAINQFDQIMETKKEVIDIFMGWIKSQPITIFFSFSLFFLLFYRCQLIKKTHGSKIEISININDRKTNFPFTELSFILGSGIMQTVFGVTEDKYTKVLFKYFIFLEKVLNEKDKGIMIKVFNFLKTELNVKSAAALSDILDKKASKKLTNLPIGIKTIQNLFLGKRLRLKSLISIAEAITEDKAEQILLIFIFILSQGIQYLQLNHSDVLNVENIDFKTIIEHVNQTIIKIPGIKNNKDKWLKNFVDGLPETQEWKNNLHKYILQLHTPGNDLLILKDSPLFPFQSSESIIALGIITQLLDMKNAETYFWAGIADLFFSSIRDKISGASKNN